MEFSLNFEDPTFDCHTHPGEIIIPRRKRIAAPDSSQDAHIFRALEGIDPQDVRAIILGQDPTRIQLGRPVALSNRGTSASGRKTTKSIAAANGGGWKQLIRDMHDGMLDLEPRGYFETNGNAAPRQGKHYDIMTIGQWRQSRSQQLPDFDSVFEKPNINTVETPEASMKNTAGVQPRCVLLVYAATEGRDGFEISATVFDSFSGLSFSAKSAWATIPITRLSLSTIGIRLIWCSCIARSHFSTFSPSRHVTGSKLMNFWMGVIFGSRPSATIEQQRSRSVITPTSSLDC